MSTPKHTPGPLHTWRRKDGDVEVADAENCVLATYHGDDSDPTCWPVTANATLGAAAPELLDELQRLADEVLRMQMAFMDGDDRRARCRSLANSALDAIAKATVRHE